MLRRKKDYLAKEKVKINLESNNYNNNIFILIR